MLRMHASKLLITNDGGPSHFATVTPIQTMVFFGPETGKLYGPWANAPSSGERHRLLALPHRLQPPPDLLRRRQPVPQTHRADPVLDQALASCVCP